MGQTQTTDIINLGEGKKIQELKLSETHPHQKLLKKMVDPFYFIKDTDDEMYLSQQDNDNLQDALRIVIPATSKMEVQYKINRNDFLKFKGYIEIYKFCNNQEIRIFQGYVYEGRRQGFGVEYGINEEVIYEGQFYQNKYNGWGRTPNYEGQFVNGQKSGWGIYKHLSRDRSKKSFVYEGYWKQDRFHGIGTLNVPKDQIEMFLKQIPINQYPEKSSDKQMDGQIENMVTFRDNQIKYVGQWSAGIIQGTGRVIRKEQIYTGQFYDGQYSGQGSLLIPRKGIEFKGKFFHGKEIKNKELPS